jgi:pre-mRNA-processing factor 6
MTRSDIGPAREADAPMIQPTTARLTGEVLEQPENMNENEEGLLGSGPYDAEDEEADRIYAQVDAKMDERRKVRREARERLDAERNKSLKPKIQEQFMDLKRQLATVDEDAWMAIPEAGNCYIIDRR